ncbi:SDR family NAD(P)-dependent oxidoreductase [Halovulum marinum]|uniref:SDR family NAD(P)-dependent oxidoreductase n=1 Tax=Halovulum marinum TaxID=2662447 RepID=UPI002D7A28BC|nr:SDR family NAD(P)-dependent oxidoreductase [Halovulum marinum]
MAINYHSSGAGAETAVAEIEAAGGEALALQGDMTRAADAAALIAAAVERWGSLDALVHVTGGLVARKPIPEITAEHWQTVMDLNVTSLLHVVQAALPHFNDGGAIVALASQAGRDGGGTGAVAYGASKGAVMSMTRAMAKELGPKLRVNAICPGMIDTDFHNVFSQPEARRKTAGNTPLKREGTSEDVGNLACYLASDRAAFITGACVDINGGTLFS